MKYHCCGKVRRIAFFTVLNLIFLLSFSACSFKKAEPKQDTSWKNEVLYAEECGFDGLKCCADEAQPCKYGQNCCVSPKDKAQNFCAPSCELGTKDSFCREAEPFCDSGLACTDGRCLTCGAENQVCCETNACSNGLQCFNNICMSCGTIGHPCCVSGAACQGTELSGEGRTECFTGACRECGFGDNVACATEPGCNTGYLNSNGLCFTCGGANQPCCQVNGKAVCTDLGSECQTGFCVNTSQ